MNHVTGQDRRNELNPQNNEVEEMDTQDGKSQTAFRARKCHDPDDRIDDG